MVSVKCISAPGSIGCCPFEGGDSVVVVDCCSHCGALSLFHGSSFAIIMMGKRKLVALFYYVFPDVLFLLLFCGSSSRCHGLVCSV